MLAIDKALVVAHDKLRLELAHRIYRHTDDDQQRRGAQTDLHTGDLLGEKRQDRHQPQEERTDQCDTVDDLRQILFGALPRPNAWNEATVALERVWDILLVENHHRIEIGE